MLFNSIVFPFFFLAVILVYYRLDRRWQNRWLLVTSYFFYGWWDWRFCSLLMFSTCLDFFMSNRLAGSEKESSRRALLAATLAANLGLLAFFKYFNFFAASTKTLLESIGFHPDFFTLKVILPVGISFYTFQSISYMIDVYRRDEKPARDFEAYAVYVAFFPQLMAGPIERARRMLPQYLRRRVFDRDLARTGIPLVLVGYFKKVVIADSMAPIVDMCFKNISETSGPDLLLGIYAFAVQIYCDFSGYTDIARGLARFLGVELMGNFTAPYLSRSISEFWRRWHVSLSSWLRDYLYIPLGGNRKGGLRKWANLIVTMLLGGVWHGAAWTFVVWGGFHGVLLGLDKLISGGGKPGREALGKGISGRFRDVLSVLLTFHLVCLGWVLFRAPSMASAMAYIGAIFVNGGGAVLLRPVMLGMIATLLIDVGQRLYEDHAWLLKVSPGWRYVIAECIVVATVLTFGYRHGGATPFIYFQF